MTTTKQKNLRRLKKREKVGNGSSLVSFQKFLTQNKNLTPEFEPGVTLLTREEVARHNTPSDMWTIYRGNVYNITPFLDYHPGGEEELLKAAGTDCTELYDTIHPWVNADAVLGHLKLGPLRGMSPVKTKTPALSEINGDARTRSRADFVSPNKVISPVDKSLRPNHSPDSSMNNWAPKTLTIDTTCELTEPIIRRVSAKRIINMPVGIFRLFMPRTL